MERLKSRLKRAIGISKRSTKAAVATVTSVAAPERDVETHTDKSAEKSPRVTHGEPSEIESLPPEVRRHLLSRLDLPELKALVHASPTFHQQYLLDRHYILPQSLEETLGCVLTDAVTVHLCLARKTDAKASLNLYSNKLSEQNVGPLKELSFEEVIAMVVFYMGIVSPLVPRFNRWTGDNYVKARDNFARPIDTRLDQYPLSRVETLRIVRAAYHFQLLCHVAADFPMFQASPTGDTSVEGFLRLLEPWHVEELYSFYIFIRITYDEILERVAWDLHPDNPRFDDQGRSPTPDGAFEVHDASWERTELQTGILLQGLPLLHKLLFEMTDHEHLVTTVQSHLCRAYLDFEDLTGLYNEIYHEERRENHSDERDRKQDVRDPLPFLEDRIDAPPFSWTMMWKGTYSNLYGWYIPDDMRPWGYIFWDAGRLERVDAINLIQDRWEVLHLHDDPRDHYPWSDY